MPDDIVVENLTKSYGAVHAVKDISFSVGRGEVFGILGPNGAGKTTTLECVEGLQPPTSGDMRVLGIDTHREPDRVKERIGVQLQASAYFEHLTLTEILELFGRFYRRSLPAEELLGKVDLVEKAHTQVKHLSGGQQQRFAIAATLVNDPEVIFLDEPTTGLDPQARRNLWEFIEEIHSEGRTVVLTTHYMEEAQTLCQRVAIMDQGELVALDTPANLIRGLDAPYQVRALVEGATPGDDVRGLDGVTGMEMGDDSVLALQSCDSTATVRALFAWGERSNARIDRLEVRPATLEDVFLARTGRVLETP